MSSDTRTPAVFLGSPEQIDRVYALGRAQRIAEMAELYQPIIPADRMSEHSDALRRAKVIFSTWGMPALTREQLQDMPELEIVLYAAGSVQAFARPLLERGVAVVSGWHANGVAVAEFATAQIILANKGYFHNTRDCSTPQGRASNPRRGMGNFGRTVAVLGAGAVGRRVIEKLQDIEVEVLVFDPFLSDAQARELGAWKVSLEEAFARADAITNHLAHNEKTRGMIGREVLSRLKPHAAFINTGRGATVDEAALVEAMRERPDALALLDVTHPEPPLLDSPLYTLPNVQLSSHIAGGVGHEVVRIADYCIEDFQRWERGQSLRYAITAEMLETLAWQAAATPRVWRPPIAHPARRLSVGL